MQALKDIALRLLNVYVSPYVENLNAHDLSLSVFGGKSQALKTYCLLARRGLLSSSHAGLDTGRLSCRI